jgi:Tfp pilus assembly protein FimT
MSNKAVQRGVGLGEALILVAVAALAVVAATARVLPGATTSETVRGAAQRVHTQFQLARVEAVSRDRPCRLAVAPDDGIVRVMDSLGTAAPGDDRVLHEAALPRTVSFAATAGESDDLEFRSDGSADAGCVELSDGVERQRVSVDPAAHLRIERWDGSRWTPVR